MPGTAKPIKFSNIIGYMNKKGQINVNPTIIAHGAVRGIAQGIEQARKNGNIKITYLPNKKKPTIELIGHYINIKYGISTGQQYTKIPASKYVPQTPQKMLQGKVESMLSTYGLRCFSPEFLFKH